MPNKRARQRIIAEDRLLLGALAGIASVGILGAVSIDIPDTPLTVALCLWSAAIPFLGVALFIINTREHLDVVDNSAWSTGIELIGALAASAGLLAFLYHFSAWYPIIMVASYFVANVMYDRHRKHRKAELANRVSEA